jgi:hypothetical protein
MMIMKFLKRGHEKSARVNQIVFAWLFAPCYLRIALSFVPTQKKGFIERAEKPLGISVRVYWSQSYLRGNSRAADADTDALEVHRNAWIIHIRPKIKQRQLGTLRSQLPVPINQIASD